MLKRSSFLLLLFLFCNLTQIEVVGQSARIEAREREWDAHAIPDAPFLRSVKREKGFVFRVPADWKQDSEGRVLSGPHSASVEIFTEKVPEGASLPDLVGSVMQAVRHTPGATESAIVRRTLLQDFEAREIVFQMPDASGEMKHMALWLTIRGPMLIGFRFSTPVGHISEIEPFFKAIIQSIMFVSLDPAEFDRLRSTAIKDPKPASVRELQSIVSTIAEQGFATEAVKNRLISLFSESPDLVIDLLFERRLFVRAAAAEALARSRNKALEPFLWRMLDDTEPVIATYAAQSVAASPDVVTKLAEQSFGGFKTETLIRLWPFLAKETRIQMLQRIFSRPVTKPALPNGTNKVIVSVTEMTPLIPGRPPKPLVVTSLLEPDPSVQLGALTLLKHTRVEEFKLPLSVILAANQETLTFAALQVAIERGESLPVDSLFKLAMSSNVNISKLAAENLSLSGETKDIQKIQTLIDLHKGNATQSNVPELKQAIETIRFREQLVTAAKISAASEVEVAKKGISNPLVARYVWRYLCEPTPVRCGLKPPGNIESKPFDVKPFGENLLPDNPQHFAAIPKPAEAIEKLYQTLHSIQMDSARAQSNLVLIMGSVRQGARQQLGAMNDRRPLIEYTGINGDSPISVASWFPDAAPQHIERARRNAIVLRVANKQQFERFITLYQREFGSFGELPHYIAILTRLLPGLPAILPFSAKSILNQSPARARPDRLGAYSSIGVTTLYGFQVRVIERTSIGGEGRIDTESTYLTYLGDTAILAPDLETIRDLLQRTATAGTERRTLSENPEFRKTVQAAGEVIYFSDVASALNLVAPGDERPLKLTENGQLRFTKSTWENSHQLTFDETDWSKPLTQFHPKDLSAPRELLPSSTLAYYFMNLDVRAAWTKWLQKVVGEQNKFVANAFAVEFERDVLEELGPECGIALLDWPDFGSTKGVVWLAYFKLKSDKLKQAFAAGTLFRGVGPTTQTAQIKIGNESYSVSIQKGFLVVSNHLNGLKALDSKEFLASTGDFSKSIAKVTGPVVAFGGYNLKAAIDAARRNESDGLQAREADLIFSVAQAFHSQSFFARALTNSVEAQSSVSMDREGRYAVSDLNYTKPTTISYVTVETHGLPLTAQKRLSSLTLRIKTKAAGAIDAIKKDVMTEGQVVEQKSPDELLLKIAARKARPDRQLSLPVTDPALASFLGATPEIQSTDPQVVKQAREIAGNDKDAWSVARKLGDWTYKNLEWKLIARADAGQTLASREADCSEFSQLYVAMARSLGLPARIVSGLAYSGSSFGGHAWVEVWCGKWIELDPTWGTDYVDATHIRNASDDLITYAALNEIDLEVVGIDRSVADFQLAPKSLAEQLFKTLPKRETSVLETALSLELLVEELMGKGQWEQLSTLEREQLSSAYSRALVELAISYAPSRSEKKDDEESDAEPEMNGMRLLRIDESGDRAEATGYYQPTGVLLKLRLLRRNGGWHLMEFTQLDLDLRLIAETMQPTIDAIQARRAGHKPNATGMSDYLRALLLLDTNPSKSLEILDAAIKSNPSVERLRLLKAHLLTSMEKGDEDAAQKLLTELVERPNPYGPALYQLAGFYRFTDVEDEKKKYVDLLKRYIQIEPADIRAHRQLAISYTDAVDPVAAEAALRKVLEIDPEGVDGYVELAEFLVLQNRLNEVPAVLDAGEKHNIAKDDLFGTVMESLHYGDELEAVKKLAASQPERMKRSLGANITLAEVHVDDKHPLQALPLLKFATTLDNKSPVAFIALSGVYRSLSRWTLALDAADKAVGRDFENAAAHYERACSLARLGRTRDAITAIKRAVELGSYYGSFIANEKDLKSLASHPEFKKLVVVSDETEP